MFQQLEGCQGSCSERQPLAFEVTCHVAQAQSMSCFWMALREAFDDQALSEYHPCLR